MAKEVDLWNDPDIVFFTNRNNFSDVCFREREAIGQFRMCFELIMIFYLNNQGIYLAWSQFTINKMNKRIQPGRPRCVYAKTTYRQYAVEFCLCRYRNAEQHSKY